MPDLIAYPTDLPCPLLARARPVADGRIKTAPQRGRTFSRGGGLEVGAAGQFDCRYTRGQLLRFINFFNVTTLMGSLPWTIKDPDFHGAVVSNEDGSLPEMTGGLLVTLDWYWTVQFGDQTPIPQRVGLASYRVTLPIYVISFS